MQHETKKFLYDVFQACETLTRFVEGKTIDDYNNELLLQSAVERQLMIIGEALNQAARIQPDLEKQITGFRQIINLRNVIVHGYATVENETIWGILQGHAEALRTQVRKLLDNQQ